MQKNRIEILIAETSQFFHLWMTYTHERIPPIQ